MVLENYQNVFKDLWTPPHTPMKVTANQTGHETRAPTQG